MRVFPVGFPFGRIAQNIFPDCGKFFFTSDNMFIIAALPDRSALGVSMFIYSTGGVRFKGTDYFRQRMVLGRGGSRTRPPRLLNNYDPMDMIGHNYKDIVLHLRIVQREAFPD